MLADLCMYVCAFARMHVCVCVSVRVYADMHACMCVCECVWQCHVLCYLVLSQSIVFNCFTKQLCSPASLRLALSLM